MIIDSDALIVENKVESGDCSSEGGLEGDPTGGDIQSSYCREQSGVRGLFQ